MNANVFVFCEKFVEFFTLKNNLSAFVSSNQLHGLLYKSFKRHLNEISNDIKGTKSLTQFLPL